MRVKVMKQIRRVFMLISIALAAPVMAGELPTVEVYKSPTCGCCQKWVEHMQRAGFEVEVRDVDNLGAIKQEAGIPRELASCHTAKVGGYVIEGHVPADDVKRLLSDKDFVKGLAVPGMPMGSPGMESSRSDAYSVMVFDFRGGAEEYARYE